MKVDFNDFGDMLISPESVTEQMALNYFSDLYINNKVRVLISCKDYTKREKEDNKVNKECQE